MNTETPPVDGVRRRIPKDFWFYECEGCRTVLKPKAGDCCVFCSHGTESCPPVQAEGRGCCG
ncbi:GDCCVxC domain-containing (seleno)protein [Ramlibacter rhizophilus]|uniref:Uncharacterized protein n=1 Tax=Ramlibacter rhizophilus TaxID=1781167 RepID=A0A4Z0BZ13_9BURK|nr:GDCCVxC domain-containing (seleno)protein [Ramlibacter rhizophilus]TFZ04546.1 hypothetical protein EZ242_02010 [Ramlibacter rhizophilus]